MEFSRAQSRTSQDVSVSALAGKVQDSENVTGLLSMLAQELHKLNSKTTTPAVADSSPSRAYHAVVSPSVSHVSTPADHVELEDNLGQRAEQPRKRRRLDSCGNYNIDVIHPLEDLEHVATSLPPADIMEDIISVYFNSIQPWIPVLHETQFRRQMHMPDRRRRLIVVLHGMVVAALRFVDNVGKRLSGSEMENMISRSRNTVILTAMDCLSVENLQGLIIVAFTDVRMCFLASEMKLRLWFYRSEMETQARHGR